PRGGGSRGAADFGGGLQGRHGDRYGRARRRVRAGGCPRAGGAIADGLLDRASCLRSCDRRGGEEGGLSMAESKRRSAAAVIRPIVLLIVAGGVGFLIWRNATRSEGYTGGNVVTTGTVEAVHVQLGFKVAG